jgi:hypothetical protein
LTRGVTGIVVLGVVAMILLGLGLGWDIGALVIFGCASGAGMLAIAAARMAARGFVTPGECPNCGGLVSPHSPHCKHCLTPL